MLSLQLGDRVVVEFGDGQAVGVVAGVPKDLDGDYWDQCYWCVFAGGRPDRGDPTPFQGHIHPDRVLSVCGGRMGAEMGTDGSPMCPPPGARSGAGAHRREPSRAAGPVTAIRVVAE